MIISRTNRFRLNRLFIIFSLLFICLFSSFAAAADLFTFDTINAEYYNEILDTLSSDKEPQIELLGTEYDYNSKTEKYSDGTNKVTFYMDMRYADSLGTPIEEAKSLKNCEFCENLKIKIQHTETKLICDGDLKTQKCRNETIIVDGYDERYPVTENDVLDFNYTSIKLSPKLAEQELNKDVPIEVYSVDSVYDEVKQETEYVKTTDYLTSVNLKTGEEDTELVLPFSLNKTVKVGDNSTLIGVYQEFVCTSLTKDDASYSTARSSETGDYSQSSPAGFGTTYYVVRNNVANSVYYLSRSVCPVNTSVIPDSATITNATATFYFSTFNNFGERTIVLVNGTASNLLSIATSDFGSLAGSLNSPKELSDRVLVDTVFNTYEEETFVLNSDGLDLINKEGMTGLFLRSGEEIDNTTPIDSTEETAITGGTSLFRGLEIYYTLNSTLNITDPTSSNSLQVSSGDNVSTNFTFRYGDNYVSEDVSISEILIGGNNVTINQVTKCYGTPSDELETLYNHSFNSDSTGWSLSSVSRVTSSYCYDDDYDYCLRFYGTSNSASAPNIDISDCLPGTVYITFYSTDYLVDSAEYFWLRLSTDNGSSYLNFKVHDGGLVDQQIFTNFSVPDYYRVNTFRFGFLSSGLDAGEYFYSDEPRINCLVPAADNCSIGNESSCEAVGCSWDLTDDLAFYDDQWHVNITIPETCSGLSSLTINASYDGSYAAETELNAIECPGGSSTCPCPESGGWELDWTDNCNVQDNCNRSGYNITFINTGEAGGILFNSTIIACNIGDIGSGNTGYLGSNAQIIVGSGCS